MNRLTYLDALGKPCFRHGDTEYSIPESRKLAAYEDTGLEPGEIVKLKAERDAAVRDIVEAMEADLSMCELTHQCWFCAFYNSDDCPLEKDGECAPKWRGPQQEEL